MGAMKRPFYRIVVADARTSSLKDTPPNMVYLPFGTLPPYACTFLVRSSESPTSLTTGIRRSIWRQDPAVTIARVTTLDAQVNDSLSTERFQTFVLIAFGFATLLLAMLGVYGILSYTIAGRTREIGVRMAFGATRRTIYAVTMSEAAIPVLCGLFTGWIASLFAARLIQTLLFGVTTTDWSVSLAVAILLLTCATTAAFLPALRAASTDLMDSPRTE